MDHFDTLYLISLTLAPPVSTGPWTQPWPAAALSISFPIAKRYFKQDDMLMLLSKAPSGPEESQSWLKKKI